MKTFAITLGVLCLGIAAAVTYTNLKNATPPAPAAEAVQAQQTVSSEPARSGQRPYSGAISNSAARSQSRGFLAASAHSRNDPAATTLMESVAMLVSPTASFQEREGVWKQLHDLEHLDQVIEALKQGATNNPNAPEYLAALGRANLQKAGIVSKNGGSMNELGILGMTADQNFDSALKIDPANWDAQFFKAVSMSYWPAELNKGDEVVQRLTGLINQQDSQTPRPEFAMSYVALGQQYQKLGQSDNALQTWQAGAAKFPNDTTLQQKISAAQSPAPH
jgi:tetratricopeptide (TPR) repeat protein